MIGSPFFEGLLRFSQNAHGTFGCRSFPVDLSRFARNLAAFTCVSGGSAKRTKVAQLFNALLYHCLCAKDMPEAFIEATQSHLRAERGAN